MPFTKDLVIATTVLVGCCLVLIMTLAEPEGGSGTVDVPGGPSLADADEQPQVPADEPPAPPPSDGERFADGMDSGLAFEDLDDLEGDGDDGTDPVVADAGPVRDNPFDGPDLFDEPDLPSDPGPGTADPVEPDEPVFDEPDEPAPRPGPRGGGKTYTVASGDSLMTISYQHYGTHHKWREIAAANPDVDPDALVVGTALTIPELDDVVPASEQGTVRGPGSYVVKKGDSYYTIARDLLGDSSRFQELVAMNTIGPYELMPGDVVKVPKGARVPAAGSATPRPTVERTRELPPGAKWYTVQRGDILGDISTRFYGTSKRWREIAEANGIADPSRLKAGQKIIIPRAGSGGSGRERSSPRSGRTGGGGSRARGRGEGQWHTVQRDDILGDLSARFYGTSQRWRRIVEANPGINPNHLTVGARIWIPGASGSTTAPERRTPPRRADDRSVPAERIDWPDLGESGGGGGSDNPFDGLDP